MPSTVTQAPAHANAGKNSTWQLEHVACNLCGADSPRTLFTNDSHGFGLTTVACENCGLVYLNPRPTAGEYRRFYEGMYERLYPNAWSPGEAANVSAHRRLAWYRSFLHEKDRLLEVGPGAGAFLDAVRTEFPLAAIEGIEPSPDAVQACRNRGLNVRQGYLQDLSVAQPFNAVAMFHVLEHSLDPVGLLKDVHDRMSPGGYLFVEVPNIRGSWRGLGMLHIAHPYQYSVNTLAALVEKAAFSVKERVEIEEPGFESSVRVVARKQHFSENSKLSLPADDPADLAVMFAERLSGWRRDLARYRVKRTLLRALGPRATRTLRGSLTRLRLLK